MAGVFNTSNKHQIVQQEPAAGFLRGFQGMSSSEHAEKGLVLDLGI